MKADKLTEFIFSNQFSSVMNRTKWKALADAMESNSDFEPEVSVKYIDDEESGRGFSLLDWEWVRFGDARVIEWIDIDSTRRTYVGRLVDKTTTDFSFWVRQQLIKHSIPFSEEGGVFRVNGYLKPNS